MGNHHCVPPTASQSDYLYCASFPAAVLFSALYGLALFGHIFQAFWYRKGFCWVVIMAAGWEFAGLVLRALSTLNQTRITFALPSQLLILLAPLWVNAFTYVMMGRMVHYYLRDGRVFRIRAQRLATLFVCLDIVAFLIQGTGGSMASQTGSGSGSAVRLGFHIYEIGLGVQQAFILGFVGLAFRFRSKVRMQEAGILPGQDKEARSSWDDSETGAWKPLFYGLLATLTLITIRIIYRLIEFSAGIYSFVPEHEWFYYVFDASLMLFALLIWNVLHPSRYLTDPLRASFPKKPKRTGAQKREEKAARKAAKKARKAGGEKVEGMDYASLPAASPSSSAE